MLNASVLMRLIPESASDCWVVEYCGYQKAMNVTTLRNAIRDNVTLVNRGVLQGNSYRILAVASTQIEASLIADHIRKKIKELNDEEPRDAIASVDPGGDPYSPDDWYGLD